MHSLPPNCPSQAIGYIRVSTEMQAAGDQALERQAETIRRFAQDNGLALLAIYEDVGSAYDTHTLSRRPGLQDATQRVAREGACLLVCEPTRLFRNVEAAEKWLQDCPAPVVSVREGRSLEAQQLLNAVRQGQQTAERIQAGTSDALAKRRERGKVLGSSGDKAAANRASVKARAVRSDQLVTTIAHILLEDQAYRALSHKALADLLNRRGVLTGWERPWTAVGIRRHRYEAEKRIVEWEELDREDDALDPGVKPLEDLPEDERKMREHPNFGMFGSISPTCSVP